MRASTPAALIALLVTCCLPDHVPAGRAAALPPARTILQAMEHASAHLRTLHGAGFVRGSGGIYHGEADCRFASMIHVVGGSRHEAVPWIDSLSHFWGAVTLHGRRQSFDTHLIVLRTAGHIHVWERTAATHGHWAQDGNQANLGGVYLLDLCYPFYAPHIIAGMAGPWTTIGTTGIGGSSAWLLFHRNGSGRDFDDLKLYIDRTTDRLLTFEDTQHTSTSPIPAQMRFVFTRFNQPVNIHAPRIGATQP